MVEEAVGLLQLVEIGDHLLCVAVEILLVAGGAIGLELQHGEHVHVVDPVARLGGEAVGLRVLPLAVGPPLAFLEKLLVLGLTGDLERHDAEDGVVHVAADGTALGLGAAGHQRLKLLDQLIAQSGVVRQLGELQRAVPGADLGVVDGLGVLVRAGDEVFGQLLCRPPAGWCLRASR